MPTEADAEARDSSPPGGQPRHSVGLLLLVGYTDESKQAPRDAGEDDMLQQVGRVANLPEWMVDAPPHLIGTSTCFLGSGQPDNRDEGKWTTGMHMIIYVCTKTILSKTKLSSLRRHLTPQEEPARTEDTWRQSPDLLMEKKSKGRAGAATESLGTAARRSTRSPVLRCHRGHRPATQEPALLLLFFKGDQQEVAACGGGPRQ